MRMGTGCQPPHPTPPAPELWWDGTNRQVTAAWRQGPGAKGAGGGGHRRLCDGESHDVAHIAATCRD